MVFVNGKICEAGMKKILDLSNGNDYTCEVCPKGTFSRQGALLCLYCDAGFYTDMEKQSKCQPCEVGTLQTGVGSAEKRPEWIRWNKWTEEAQQEKLDQGLVEANSTPTSIYPLVLKATLP